MLDKQTAKEIALSCGFKLKEQANGEMNLNPYVYEFANAIAKHCWSAFKSGVVPHKIHPTKASLNNGWISVDDVLPYCHRVFTSDWHEDWRTNKYCPLQIIAKDNVLHTAVFLEMKIQDFHGEKLFWLCDIENLNGRFVIHEISDDFLEIDEVKYWQPLPQPPKE